MKTRFLVYALVDPRTDGVRYIGKTVLGAHDRLRKHLSPSYLKPETHKNRWLRKLLAAGSKPRFDILEEHSSAETLPAAERAWIVKGRRLGWRLTNATEGGEGTPGWVPSDLTRKRMSVAAKARGVPRATIEAGVRARAGKKQPPEQVAARVAKITGRKYSPEHCAALSKALRGRTRTDAERAKTSAGLKAAWAAGKYATRKPKRSV